jgi:NAD(P)-dependent dehydrogenase (short-subunit alcohol dehydrogenase family)
MITKALAQNGAKKIYIIGRRKEKLDEAAKEFAVNENIVPIEGDITSQDSLSAIAKQIEDDTGYINLLVANAGIMGPKIRPPLDPAKCSLDEFVEHAWKTPMEDFTHTYEVNVTGVYYSVLAFLKLLDAGNKGNNRFREGVSSQVVGVSSIAGYSRLRGASFAYNSSKAALTHLMKHLSTWCGRWDVRCNVISPGSMSSLGLSHHFMIPIPLPNPDDEDDG